MEFAIHNDTQKSSSINRIFMISLLIFNSGFSIIMSYTFLALETMEEIDIIDIIDIIYIIDIVEERQYLPHY